MTKSVNGKEVVTEWLDENAGAFYPVSDAIWSYAELGCEEHLSARLLCNLLQEHGFQVEASLAGMPTAFIARWGNGGPLIGLNCEYDSLTGLSQHPTPEKAPVVEGAPGHGCGHNLLGVGSCMAAISVKQWLKATGKPGTVAVLGCPAEELCIGKPFMARAGLFEGFDSIIDWHPFFSNSAHYDCCNSYFSLKYHFKGRTTHGNTPWLGRSAVDSALLMAHSIELLREHISPGNSDAPTTINYTFSELGPEYPSVVSDRSTIWVVGRIKDSAEMERVMNRIDNCAKAAALATETTWRKELVTASHERIPNKVLSALIHRNLTEIGSPKFNSFEQDFARKLQREASVAETGLNEDVADLGGGYSGVSDNSEFSWFAPFALLRITAAPTGLGWHSWQVTASVGTSIGKKAMTTASKVLAASVVEMMSRPAVLEEARREYLQRLSGRKYRSLIPKNNKPPIHINQKIMDKYRLLLDKYRILPVP